MYEFKAIASDGELTIGYDADGLAGMVPGNMVTSFEKVCDFRMVCKGREFYDGHYFYVAQQECDSFGNKVLFWNKVS